MVQIRTLSLDIVQGVLERQLLVGPHALIGRYGEHDGLKIEKVEGIPEGVEKGLNLFAVYKLSLTYKGLKLHIMGAAQLLAGNIPEVDYAPAVEIVGTFPLLLEVKDGVFRICCQQWP